MDGSLTSPGSETGAGTQARVADAKARVRNAMSIDVEDYFQVSAFLPYVRRDEWDSLPSRVERNTDRLLELFAEEGAHATFFTLGWVAERFPALVRRIAEGGHEVASHGYEHTRVRDQSPEEFRADIRRTRALLEDAAGVRVIGYRAASFSMGPETPWAHDILAEEGHLYSSSIFPIAHDHYGHADAPRFAYAAGDGSAIREIPLTTVQLGSRNLPCAGGGYFRLFPYSYFRWGFRRVNSADGQPCIFYLHPWEIDPGQPRRPGLNAKGVFVVNCCMALRMADIPDENEFKTLYPGEREWINVGRSCVINPRGQIIAGPLEGKEGLVIGEIDFDEITAAKRMFDVAGHYARPDVFGFSVRRPD